ncbi:hypothetical protein CL617_05695 [archaeon]|nr:hypothetical protein [archaeon]|tara:strand:+ start:431 stop:670 length:240 start_codon:yes stop_codon:yes gene_type:complete
MVNLTLIRHAESLANAKRITKEHKTDEPFRGPNNFKEDNFEYKDENKGSIENFKGVERIFYKGKEVYRLYYHGGVIKNK